MLDIEELIDNEYEIEDELIEINNENNEDKEKAYSFYSKTTSLKKIREYAIDPDYRIRLEIAKNKNIPKDVAYSLIFDEEYFVRYNLLNHKKVDQVILRVLQNDVEPFIRRMVALKSDMIDIIEKLSKDQDIDVLIAIASNPLTNLNILNKLSMHESKYVRSAVAKCLYIDEEIINRLSNDESECVKTSLCENQATPLNILKKLKEENINNINILKEIAKNRNIDEEMAMFFLNNPYYQIRLNFIFNPSNKPSWLKNLFNDSIEIVRIESKKRFEKFNGYYF